MELYRRSNARSLNHKAALLSRVIHPSSGDNNACPLLFGLTSRVHHKFISRWNWWMSRPLCSDLAWPLRTRLCCQPLHLYININWIDLRAATRDKVLLKHSMAEIFLGNGTFYWLSFGAGEEIEWAHHHKLFISCLERKWRNAIYQERFVDSGSARQLAIQPRQMDEVDGRSFGIHFQPLCGSSTVLLLLFLK